VGLEELVKLGARACQVLSDAVQYGVEHAGRELCPVWASSCEGGLAPGDAGWGELVRVDCTALLGGDQLAFVVECPSAYLGADLQAGKVAQFPVRDRPCDHHESE